MASARETKGESLFAKIANMNLRDSLIEILYANCSVVLAIYL